MGVKKLNKLKKFMQVEVDMKRMQINFGGHCPSGFWRFGSFFCLQKRPKFTFEPWNIVHGDQNIGLAQKIYAVRG